MHILVVHAMVILLTLGPPQGECSVLRFIQGVMCNPESLRYICHLLTGQAGVNPYLQILFVAIRSIRILLHRVKDLQVYFFLPSADRREY